MKVFTTSGRDNGMIIILSTVYNLFSSKELLDKVSSDLLLCHNNSLGRSS